VVLRGRAALRHVAARTFAARPNAHVERQETRGFLARRCLILLTYCLTALARLPASCDALQKGMLMMLYMIHHCLYAVATINTVTRP